MRPGELNVAQWPVSRMNRRSMYCSPTFLTKWVATKNLALRWPTYRGFEHWPAPKQFGTKRHRPNALQVDFGNAFGSIADPLGVLWRRASIQTRMPIFDG